jgi:hypothetical protein
VAIGWLPNGGNHGPLSPGNYQAATGAGRCHQKPKEVKARRQRAATVIEGRNLDHEFRKEWESAFSKFEEDHKYLELYIKTSEVPWNVPLNGKENGMTKNNEGRSVYLDSELRGVLLNQLETQENNAKLIPQFFPNEQQTNQIQTLQKAWGSACIKAGFGARDEQGKKIPTTLFHDLRRSAVRNLVRSEVPEAVAVRISGHKTRSVFKRYNVASEHN